MRASVSCFNGNSVACFNSGRENEEGEEEFVSGTNLLLQIKGETHSQESFACLCHLSLAPFPSHSLFPPLPLSSYALISLHSLAATSPSKPIFLKSSCLPLAPPKSNMKATSSPRATMLSSLNSTRSTWTLRPSSTTSSLSMVKSLPSEPPMTFLLILSKKSSKLKPKPPNLLLILLLPLLMLQRLLCHLLL